MYSQDMFSVQALFYEAWAEVLESKGDNKRADEVYNLGIQRNAQPLERLKRQLRYSACPVRLFSTYTHAQ